MNSLFSPYLQAPLSSQVDSIPVDLGWADHQVPVSITSGAAVLVVNGVPAGQSANVVPTDDLVVRLTTAATYATASHVVLTVDGVPYSYTAVTRDDDRLYQYPPQVGILPLDLGEQHDGSDFFDNGSANRLATYSSSAQFLTRINAEYTGQPVGSSGADGVIYSPVNRSDFVLRLDRHTFDILGSVTVGDLPFQSIVFGAQPSAMHVVSISGEDRVSVLDRNGVQLVDIPTSGRPMGLACSATSVYVACWTDHAIDVLTRNSSTGQWSRSVISTGAHAPMSLAWDGQYLWSTCPDTDTLLKIDGSTVSQISLPGLPTAIAFDGTNLWVTLGRLKSVVRMNLSGVIQSTHVVEEMPYSLAVDAPGSVYVGAFGRANVYKIQAGVTTLVATDSKYPYQLLTSPAGKLAVFEYYPQTPSYLYAYDASVTGLRVTDAFRLSTLQNVTTNVTTVTGLSDGISLPVSIPNLYGATIIKNGQAVGLLTSATNGDQLSINFTVPARADCDIQIPLFIGNNYDYFLSVVPVPDPVIFPVVFAHLSNAQLNTTYTSNTVTISGIDAGTSITLTLTGGVLVKNGSMLPGIYTTQVTNGDTIAVKVTSSANMGIAATCLLNFGVYKTYWSVITSDIVRNWLNPSYIQSEVYEIPVPTQYDNSYRAGNSIQRIKKSDYTIGPELSLYNPTVVPNSSLVEFNYAVSYYENRVYKISPNGSVAAISTFDTNSLPRPDGLHNPQFHGKTVLLKSRFVSVSEFHIREVDTPDADVPLYVGTGWAPCTVKSVDGQYLYVGQEDRRIGVYKYDTASKLFVRHSTVDCTSACPQPGGFRELVLDLNGGLWALDVVNNVLLHLVSGEIVSYTSLGTSNIWAMTAGINSIWLADTNHNTVIKIGAVLGDLQAIVRVGSVPSALELDSTTGNIWVAYYASTKIDIINPNTNQITRTLTLASPVADMRQDSSGYIWVLHMYPDMYTRAGATVSDADIQTPVFLPLVGASPTVHVKSNSALISGLPRPIRVTVADINNTRIYLNGDTVGAVSVSVDNSDTMVLGTDAPLDFASTTNVIFTGFNTAVEWSVSTSADISPDYVYFDPVYDIRLRYLSKSSPVTIAGLSPGASTLISVLGQPQMQIYVDDLPYLGTASVMNGSMVRLEYDTTGWYYGQLRVFELQHGLPGSASTFGTFDVSTLVLLGAVRNAIYDVSVYDYVSYTPSLYNSSLLSAVGPTATNYSGARNATGSAELASGTNWIKNSSLIIQGVTPLPYFLPKIYSYAEPLAPILIAQNSPYLSPEVAIPQPEARTVHATVYQQSPIPWVENTIGSWVDARLAEYEPDVYHEQRVAAAVYELAVHHDANLVLAEYTTGLSYTGHDVEAEYEPRVTYAGRTVLAEYEPRSIHDNRTVLAEYEPRVTYAGRTARSRYQLDVSRNSPSVAAYWQPGHTESLSTVDAPLFISQVSSRQVTAPLLTPIRIVAHSQHLAPAANYFVPHYADLEILRPEARHDYDVNEMSAGQLSEQGVFATQQGAINAALARGYDLSIITTWWFHTYIDEGSGVNELAVAWMWKVPPEITTRSCGTDAAGGSKYPVPQKWYVQGG